MIFNLSSIRIFFPNSSIKKTNDFANNDDKNVINNDSLELVSSELVVWYSVLNNSRKLVFFNSSLILDE